jgi:hypothetical protein
MIVYVFENIVIMIADLNRFFFHPVTVINFCGFFFQMDVFAVYFNLCILIFALIKLHLDISL